MRIHVAGIFILLFICFPLAGRSQEIFIKACNNPDNPVTVSEIQWLKYILKTTDCTELAGKISGLSSFTEVLPPGESIYDRPSAESWMAKRPHYAGLNLDSVRSGLDSFKREMRGSFHKDSFYDLELFQEFTNLKHINMTTGKHDSICWTLEKLPFLETMTIPPMALGISDIDDCLFAAKVKVFLKGKQTSYYEYTSTPKTEILGIEVWRGELEPLLKLPTLKFLDMELVRPPLEDISILRRLSNLTHLTMYTPAFQGIEKVSAIKSLIHLSVRFTQKIISDGEGESFIKDISFVKQLQYLRHLNLSGNSIEDMSPVLSLPRLEKLQLSNNHIADVPDLSSLKKLTYLDLSANAITSVETLSKAKNLEFLKLQRNKLKNIEALVRLEKLRFLDVAINAFPDKRVSLPDLSSLEVLNLSGHPGRYPYVHSGALSGAFQDKTIEQQDTINRITEMTTAGALKLGCEIVPTLKTVSGINLLKNLRVLILSNQDFDTVDGLSELKQLRYLDYSNNTSTVPFMLKDLTNLKVIDYSHTQIPEFDYEALLPEGAMIESDSEFRSSFLCREEKT